MENNIPAPNSEVAVARRRALSEAIRRGDPVFITPTGVPETEEEAVNNGFPGIEPPKGKFA